MIALVRCEEGAAARSEPPPRVTLTTSTPFCERPLNQVMDMLLPPRAGEPLRAAQPVHIRA